MLAIRTLFHTCKLVHADLSEYNILYHAGILYIIDVSQSVEQDHPHAFDFLRSDVRNVESFFTGRPGVKALGVRRCFEFITRERVVAEGKEETDEQALSRWIEEGGQDEDDEEGQTEDKEADDAVFMKSYIPRTLNEVYDPERDIAAVKRGEGEKLIYADTIGLIKRQEEEVTPGKPGVHFGDEKAEDEEQSSDDEDEDQSGEDGEDKPFEERQPRGHRNEDKEVKKVCPSLSLMCWPHLTNDA